MNMLIKRAAIYVRVSSKEEAEEGTSLGTQEERSLIYCKEHNYKVNPNLLFRETKSAKDYINRDELAKLREAARRGEFDILVVYVYDRLSRKMVHQAVIIDDLERHGIRVESVTEPFDNSTVGIFLRNARAFAAELELEKIKERTMRGILKKVTNGQLIGGGKPSTVLNGTKTGLDIYSLIRLLQLIVQVRGGSKYKQSVTTMLSWRLMKRVLSGQRSGSYVTFSTCTS